MSAVQSFSSIGRLLAAAGVLVAVFAAGCDSSEYDVAAAKGKVVCGDRPVPVGSVTFTPIGGEGNMEPGKPATATVDADGTFVLSTYDPNDGAVIGKHRVNYWPPEGNDEEDEGPAVEEGSAEERQRNAERAKRLKALTFSPCEQTQPMEVEVTAAGPNEFTIELSPIRNGGEGEGSSGD